MFPLAFKHTPTLPQQGNHFHLSLKEIHMLAQVQLLSWEDHLEKEGVATHSSILAWRIPCTDETGGLQSVSSQRIRYDW